MGMGKTIQTIALLLAEPRGKPNLVVAPTVALMQWKSEIEQHTNNGLSVCVFYGTNRTITAKEMKEYDVVLTTCTSPLARACLTVPRRCPGECLPETKHGVQESGRNSQRTFPPPFRRLFPRYPRRSTQHQRPSLQHRKSSLCPQNEAQTLSLRNTPPKPNRRIILAAEVPASRPIRLLLLQEVRLQGSPLDLFRSSSL
jgi:hypothetical protein